MSLPYLYKGTAGAGGVWGGVGWGGGGGCSRRVR